MKQVSGQMSLFDLDMPCGRTSQAPFLPTKAKTFASSSKSFAKSKTKAPMFLDLRTGSGNLAGVSWETGIPSHGVCLMLNFGEFPNVVEESGLSQILEDNVPQRYYLSERACVGVLRRAERRGKELKPILKLALEQQIERWRKYGSPLPVFGEHTKICVIYDEENITSKVNASNPQIGDPCHTLGRKGAGRTLLCQCYDARGNGDGKVAPTITGDHNGHMSDYTALVCEKFAENSSGDGISGTIDAHYYLGCGARGGKEREFVVFSIDRAAFNQGKNAQYDIGIDESGIAQTVVAKGPGAVCYEIGNGQVDNNDQVLFQHTQTQYIVRRLTPIECCRLQGMPDFWTDGVEGSDAARYKLWGNGMALPNALYIMEGLVENDER